MPPAAGRMRTTHRRHGDSELDAQNDVDADLHRPPSACADREELLRRFQRVRQASLEMCRSLAPEVFRLQPAEEVSPPWWNLGHTSWFFVRNVLMRFGGVSDREDAEFDHVLNSYYATFGERLARSRRGSLSRPTTAEIYEYRASVDRRIEALLKSIDERQLDELEFRLAVGINHEQQHQELFYTEVKYILAQDAPGLRTPYLQSPRKEASPSDLGRLKFIEFAGGLLEFGHADSTWCWDNELPRHKYYLASFALADRLATNRDYLEFMEDCGYRRQLLWLDNGWRAAQEHGWQAPLYWERLDGQWWNWTLAGPRPLALDEPVCHVSFYEADAFARWCSEDSASECTVRLPTEREWEHASRSVEQAIDQRMAEQSFLNRDRLHPSSAAGHEPLRQLFGVVWQWTASYHEPYPGYRTFAGELAEYNGKFMDNQRVLRGGSCVTPRDHFRVTYRNFWPAAARFQFSGIRLARDLEA